jgi:hypothetical protein
LRHSFISALANSGVSSELRRRLSGHASEEMHAVYTHHELETIRQAVSAIPRLPARDRSELEIVTHSHERAYTHFGRETLESLGGNGTLGPAFLPT